MAFIECCRIDIDLQRYLLFLSVFWIFQSYVRTVMWTNMPYDHSNGVHNCSFNSWNFIEFRIWWPIVNQSICFIWFSLKVSFIFLRAIAFDLKEWDWMKGVWIMDKTLITFYIFLSFFLFLVFQLIHCLFIHSFVSNSIQPNYATNGVKKCVLCTHCTFGWMLNCLHDSSFSFPSFYSSISYSMFCYSSFFS